MKTETLGQRLKRLRQAAGMSQADLAEAAGVPIGTIRGIEYDRREPLLGTAAKVAHALGISLDVLAQNNGETEAKPAPAKRKRGK